MRRFWILTLAGLILLASCESPSKGQSTPTRTEAPFTGRVRTTTILSEGLDIAIMVASPQTPRYTEGAGVVVVASPIFTETNGFMTDPDLPSLGLIQVSYLWPGKSDSKTKAKSSGEFDYGGDQSVKVLRDVIRFAANRMADKSGRYIVSLTSVAPLVGEVGVYAFSDAGIDAIRAFALYGAQMQGLGYFIGREVPTVDSISCMEIGHYNDSGQPVYNPFYKYPASYSTTALTLNYSNVRWDPSYISSTSKAVGIPYLDLDGNGSLGSGDFVFDGQIPVMFGKRYYSTALEAALLSNGALSLAAWPADLATLQEAAQAWKIRQTPGLFETMQADDIIKDMKVMLVFAQNEHAQVAQDKPHIHQLYQGFRFEARLWVRLNPDLSYAESMFQIAGTGSQENAGITPTPVSMLDFPDNPADTQPSDWTKIGDYAYPNQGQADRLVPLAAVAEMADRTHAGSWDANLDAVLYIYPAPTPQP
ncbi:MAG: hypothetical protein ABSF99_05230 [Anaerolineales bacterium]|jgi:hypothetical protein